MVRLICANSILQRRMYCYQQRMGGINSIALSQDEMQIISMGQEKRICFWENGAPSPVHEDSLPHEEEGLCLVR